MSEYKIILKSTVDGETNEVLTYGDVTEEYGSVAVRYADEESGGPTKIVIGNDTVNIIKEGNVNTVMTFEEGKVTEAGLATEYGVIPFTYRTTGISSSVSERGVRLELNYVTEMGGEENRFNVVLNAIKKIK